MERETTVLETPIAKHKIEIKTYLTGREKRALTNVFLEGNLDFNADSKDIKGINFKLMDKHQNLAWETIIVSIDGKKNGEINIVETVLDMRAEDSDFIIEKVNEVTQDFEKKKTS